MNELLRIKELIDYQILDTDPEEELNELAEIASAVCGSPMSIISFIDGERQWYKAKVGLTNNEVKKEESFCQFTLDKPDELLIVEDASKSEKFCNYAAVQNAPHIRFYTGVPLVSPNGNVLGTLCVMNTVPMKITELQKQILKVLAKRVMHFLNSRKLILMQKQTIEFSADKLKKLTDQAPVAIFQLEATTDKVYKFNFISKGFTALFPSLDLVEVKQNPETLFRIMHPDDISTFKQSISQSNKGLSDWFFEYRIMGKDKEEIWHLAKATPEQHENGSVIWYGTFQDITNRKIYENTIEQIAFDISHVLRRPVANLLGLTALINKDKNIDEARIKEYSDYINKVSLELDNYTHKLNETYSLKNEIIHGLKTTKK